MSDNHPKFLAHLEESKGGVWLAARWLSDMGYVVQINPQDKAPRHQDWKSYADHGDLQISQRVEVKQLSVNFTSAEDWPFGEKFIVCAKHAFDNAKPKPFAYIILNCGGTHAAIVKAETRNLWKIEERTDRRYNGVSQQFYLAPMKCVSFYGIKNGGLN